MIILPRQARDKHRETSKKSTVFSQSPRAAQSPRSPSSRHASGWDTSSPSTGTPCQPMQQDEVNPAYNPDDSPAQAGQGQSQTDHALASTSVGGDGPAVSTREEGTLPAPPSPSASPLPSSSSSSMSTAAEFRDSPSQMEASGKQAEAAEAADAAEVFEQELAVGAGSSADVAVPVGGGTVEWCWVLKGGATSNDDLSFSVVYIPGAKNGKQVYRASRDTEVSQTTKPASQPAALLTAGCAALAAPPAPAAAAASLQLRFNPHTHRLTQIHPPGISLSAVGARPRVLTHADCGGRGAESHGIIDGFV